MIFRAKAEQILKPEHFTLTLLATPSLGQGVGPKSPAGWAQPLSPRFWLPRVMLMYWPQGWPQAAGG